MVAAVALRRIAKRFDLGAATHGREGWKACLKSPQASYEFALEAYNHMQEHLMKMMNGETMNDDHLSAVGWGVSFVGKQLRELSEKLPFGLREAGIALATPIDAAGILVSRIGAGFSSAWDRLGGAGEALLRGDLKGFGKGIFNIAGPYESLFSGGTLLLVYWLILYWLYRRKLFLRI